MTVDSAIHQSVVSRATVRRRQAVNDANPPPTISQVLNMWNDGFNTERIALRYGVHEATIYNMLARLDQKLEARA